MDIEAEAVAEPVAERSCERAALDDVARRRVCVDAGHAGPDRFEPGQLRGEHDVVRLPQLAVELAGGEGPRVVGDVPADAAPGVDHDELAGLDDAVAGARVRLRAGRSGADDRLERLLGGPLLVVEPRDVPRDVALAPADERHLAHEPLEHPVRDRAGAPEGLELALVLDRAQLLDEPLARNEVDPAPAQLLRERPGEDIRLEADASAELLREPADQGALRLHRLDALDGSRLLDVAEVGEEPRALRFDEQRDVRAVEPGEVEDVDRVRDQKRLLEEGAQPCDPCTHALCSLRCRRAIL